MPFGRRKFEEKRFEENFPGARVGVHRSRKVAGRGGRNIRGDERKPQSDIFPLGAAACPRLDCRLRAFVTVTYSPTKRGKLVSSPGAHFSAPFSRQRNILGGYPLHFSMRRHRRINLGATCTSVSRFDCGKVSVFRHCDVAVHWWKDTQREGQQWKKSYNSNVRNRKNYFLAKLRI